MLVLLLAGAMLAAACSSEGATSSTTAGSTSGVDGTLPDGTAFAWDDSAFDAYAMTYTQSCGSNFVATEPTSVWVEGAQPPLELAEFGSGSPSIPDLLEVVASLGDGFDVVEFSEGEFGQPERITIDRTGDARRVFCFELIDFDGANRDGDGRIAVPAFGSYQPNAEGTEFTVGIVSCNGEPEVAVVESASAITFSVEAARPEGGGGDECTDIATVTLDAPIGDRDVIDGVGGRVITGP